MNFLILNDFRSERKGPLFSHEQQENPIRIVDKRSGEQQVMFQRW